MFIEEVVRSSVVCFVKVTTTMMNVRIVNYSLNVNKSWYHKVDVFFALRLDTPLKIVHHSKTGVVIIVESGDITELFVHKSLGINQKLSLGICFW